MCAGAGGQALGLEQAGFDHLACVEIDAAACETLRMNRPEWGVVETDLREWAPSPELRGVSLLAGGVPCPPFSMAGKQLGADDERDLFPEMVRLTRELQPRAVMIENVRGLLAKKFDQYRADVIAEFEELGYVYGGWELFNAADFGVPQARLRAIFVAVQPDLAEHFEWPEPNARRVTVGQALRSLMSKGGWEQAADWAANANDVGPALVGGSKKHGGPDLGPTRAREYWRKLGVNGGSIAEYPPEPGFVGMPRLTVEMAAVIQGFPKNWKFSGRKTAAYRQVGNAFPPPVAAAVGHSIHQALVLADEQGSQSVVA
ncbi:DNA (cytosine-5-)-methyltransferase [Rhodococcus indonesiensis]|uniref:DNA cytosine methyltransferase n=1 Tax=Rhodococcus indonesiensis TaxID=3055869 RepID=UPI002E23B79E